MTLKKIHSVSNFERLKGMPDIVKNPIPYFIKWEKAYGKVYRFNLGKTTGLVINSPSIIQQILQKQHKSFEKSIIQTELLSKYIGNGLLTNTGDDWLRQRRAIQPAFHKKRLEQVSSIIVAEINKFIDELNVYSEKSTTVDMSELMMKSTFQIIGKSLFSDSQSEDELEFIGHVITAVQNHFVKNIRLPFLRAYYKFSGTNKKYEDLVRSSDFIINRVIKERKEGKVSSGDLLDMLLDIKYEDNGEGMTTKQIRDEALILFVAGHETSANAMTWLWYILDKHPEVVEKLRAESEQVLQGKDPKFMDIMALTYTKQVIQESMRLYPPAWMMDRVAIEDVVIEDYEIKKGEIVMPFIYGVHNHKDYWENPEEFDPERFSKENAKQIPSYAYFPFGGGPRLCIGMQFAMMEMQFLVAMLVRNFDFTLAQNHQPELQPLITLRPRGGLKMKVKKV